MRSTKFHGLVFLSGNQDDVVKPGPKFIACYCTDLL